MNINLENVSQINFNIIKEKYLIIAIQDPTGKHVQSPQEITFSTIIIRDLYSATPNPNPERRLLNLISRIQRRNSIETQKA